MQRSSNPGRQPKAHCKALASPSQTKEKHSMECPVHPHLGDCWAPCAHHILKLESYFTEDTKAKLKRLKYLNGRPEIIRCLEEHAGRKLPDAGLDNDLQDTLFKKSKKQNPKTAKILLNKGITKIKNKIIVQMVKYICSTSLTISKAQKEVLQQSSRKRKESKMSQGEIKR